MWGVGTVVYTMLMGEPPFTELKYTLSLNELIVYPN